MASAEAALGSIKDTVVVVIGSAVDVLLPSNFLGLFEVLGSLVDVVVGAVVVVVLVVVEVAVVVVVVVVVDVVVVVV